MAKTFNFDDFTGRSGAGHDSGYGTGSGAGYGSGQHPNCMACEELFTDVLDEVASASDLVFFDQHVAGCTSCMEAFSQAKRGAAWLDLLKTTRPEPSGTLMERILAQTSGAAGQAAGAAVGMVAGAGVAAVPANVLPFVARPVPVSQFTRLTRIAMEPRLAMTAAMAFFSIALTMNLLGVRLDQLHAEDLKPANFKRTFYEAKASGHRYYDNLRVVRVLESRVDDLRQSSQDDRQGLMMPERKAAPGLEKTVPEKTGPEKTEPRPEQKKADPADPRGSSRRENPLPEGPAMLKSGVMDAPELRMKNNGGLV